MGRPPSNGSPSFRFSQAEIAEMEAILQAHKTALPERQVLVSLAEKFSKSEERLGKTEVQIKQVWNWFQNRRFAIRAKAAKATSQLNPTQMAREDSAMVKGVPQATQPHAASSVTVKSLPQALQLLTVPSAPVRTFPQAPQHPPAFSVQTAGRVADNSQMEYEAKSARDGAWYDVSTFLSHRSLETGDPEALVRFAGFGVEEDEWVNVCKHVRQRSLPCESSECVAVLPADLILCFQEGKEQALYFDAHVLDAQRRRHDVRGCRCRFLVRYDHDQSEEIVPLRKICRRPETDYRLQQLHAVNESVSANQIKSTANNNNIHTGSSLRVYPPAEVQPKQNKADPVVPSEASHKRPRLDSVVPPEGTEKQSKVEPDVMTDVPQNQQTVQPAVPASSSQPIVEPQKVEPMSSFPSNQVSVEPKEAELAVPVPSAQSSGESQNAVPVAPTIIDEAPVGVQQVQPVMLDVSTEVTVDPQKVETEVVVPLTEASEEHNKSGPVPSGEVPEAVGPAIPPSAEVPVGPHEGGSEVAEPQKELVVSSSSVQLPAELQEVQPDVPDQPHISNLETKTEEPMVRVSTKEPNVVEEPIENKSKEPDVSVYINVPDMVEAIESKIEGPVVPVTSNDVNVVQETKTEEPVVPSSDPNVVLEAAEAKTEEPVVPVSTNDPNVVETIESNIEEPVVPVSSNDRSAVQEAKTEESVVPVSGNAPNVVQETETEEPVMPVSTNDPTAVQEAKTEEPVASVSSNTPNVFQETKTDEPVMPVYNNDPNVVQEVSEAQTEEPVVHVSPKDLNVVQPEESVLPASDPNFDQS